MTVLVGIAYATDSKAPLVAVITTDEGAEYVTPKVDGTKDQQIQGFDQSRIDWLLGEAPEPTTAEGWYALATLNLGHQTEVTTPEEQRTPGAARGRAQEMLDAQAALRVGNVGRRASQIAVGEAYDAWAETHPDAADALSEGEDIEPQDMLDLQVLQLPPTNPDVDHAWLPHTIGEDDCVICNMPLDWEAHTNQDTIKDTNSTDGG
jgi:hypothetical protein